MRFLALNILQIAQVCSNSNAGHHSHSRMHGRPAALSIYRICHRCIPCRRYSPCNYASSCFPAFLQGYKAVPECRERQRKAFPTGYLLPRCVRKLRTPIPATAFWPFYCSNIFDAAEIISINPQSPNLGVLLKIEGLWPSPRPPAPIIFRSVGQSGSLGVLLFQ